MYLNHTKQTPPKATHVYSVQNFNAILAKKILSLKFLDKWDLLAEIEICEGYKH